MPHAALMGSNLQTIVAKTRNEQPLAKWHPRFGMDLKQEPQNRGGAFFQIPREHDELGGGRSAIRPIRYGRSGGVDHERHDPVSAQSAPDRCSTAVCRVALALGDAAEGVGA
jgi:hypothetical protein